MAGTLFVLPGMPALLVLSAGYILWQDTTVVAALFAGIAPAVPAVVAVAAFVVPALCCRRERRAMPFGQLHNVVERATRCTTIRCSGHIMLNLGKRERAKANS